VSFVSINQKRKRVEEEAAEGEGEEEVEEEEIQFAFEQRAVPATLFERNIPLGSEKVSAAQSQAQSQPSTNESKLGALDRLKSKRQKTGQE
jgi:hypothetical protein